MPTLLTVLISTKFTIVSSIICSFRTNTVIAINYETLIACNLCALVSSGIDIIAWHALKTLAGGAYLTVRYGAYSTRFISHVINIIRIIANLTEKICIFNTSSAIWQNTLRLTVFEVRGDYKSRQTFQAIVSPTIFLDDHTSIVQWVRETILQVPFKGVSLWAPA